MVSCCSRSERTFFLCSGGLRHYKKLFSESVTQTRYMRMAVAMVLSLTVLGGVPGRATEDPIEKLRDRQDRVGLEARASALHTEADKAQKDAEKWYRSAVAHSYVAEVAYELRDKGGSERAAQAGVA